MRRVLPEAVLSEVGRLDPAAIAEVCADAWPDVRDAEELHDALLSLVAFPTGTTAGIWSGGKLSARLQESISQWSGYFEQLVAERRAGRVRAGEAIYWVAAERAAAFQQIFPGAEFPSKLPKIESAVKSREEVVLDLATGWTLHSGPVTVGELGAMLGLGAADGEKAMLRLEASGAVLRGQFTDTRAGETEWCDRRLLARIHRLTLGTLRKQVESVTAAQFMRWLLRWQHIAPNSQVSGERGTLEILQRMQGFEAPANSWERQILARRIADYDPKVLDQLCLTGAVGWGRVSPHPATLETISTERRRVVPTSVAPITFFIREDADWMIPHREAGDQEMRGLSPDAQAVFQFLRQRGASFFADIVRGTGRLKAEVETALWELVAGGLLTADGFDNLRALIDPKRRSGQGHGRGIRPRHSAGRWSLLYSGEPVERARALEATCWMLLKRYGIVFREILSRETILPKWREVLMTLRRLEDKGDVRGGRFVSGLLGEQFALPTAVESLRAQRNVPAKGEVVTLSAADPLNLVGIVVPGERVAANSGRMVAFRDGVAVPPGEQPGVVMLAAG
jgi:ATP-dependent Lhr-like helicase